MKKLLFVTSLFFVVCFLCAAQPSFVQKSSSGLTQFAQYSFPRPFDTGVRGTSQTGNGGENKKPKSLSDRMVDFILSLLENKSKKIDEQLVRDHL